MGSRGGASASHTFDPLGGSHVTNLSQNFGCWIWNPFKCFCFLRELNMLLPEHKGVLPRSSVFVL